MPPGTWKPSKRKRRPNSGPPGPYSAYSPTLQRILESVDADFARMKKSTPVGSVRSSGVFGNLNLSDAELYRKINVGEVTQSDIDIFAKAKKPASADVLTLLSKIDAAQTQIEARGEEPKKQNKSLLNRTFDVISRPLYGTANIFEHGARVEKEMAEKKGKERLGWLESFKATPKVLKDAPGQFWQGVSGKQKVTYGEYLEEKGMKEGRLKTLLSLALDIGADPTTYLTLGGSVAVKGGTKGIKAVTTSAEAATKGIKFGSEVDKATATAIKTIGKGLKESEKVEHAKSILPVQNKLAKMAAKDARQEWQKANRFTMDPSDYAVASRKVEEKAFDDALGNIIETSQKILNMPNKKAVAVKLAGQRITPYMSVPDYMTTLTKNLTTSTGINVKLARAKKAFDVKFRSNAVGPELSALKAEEIGHSLERVSIRHKNLKSVFGHGVANPELRQRALEAVRFGSGEVVRNSNNVDLADEISKGVSSIWATMDDLDITVQDWNKFAPTAYKLPLKKNLDINEAWKKAWKETDGGKLLATVQTTYERVLAHHALQSSITEGFGVSLKTVSAAERGALKKAGYRSLQGLKGSTRKFFEGHIFPAEVAENTEKLLKILDGERQISKTVQYLNRATRPIKYILTVPNPGFHVRNAMGDIWINMIDGVDPRDFEKAISVVHKQGTKFSDEMLLSQDPMMAATLQAGVSGKGTSTLVKFKNQSISQAEVWAAYNKLGGRSTFFSDIEKIFNEPTNPILNALRTADEKVRRFSEIREDSLRLAHFIHLVRKDTASRTFDEAAKKAMVRVRKMHVDYQNFTPFEKKIMASVFPFYKWQRGMMPAMVETLFARPGAYTVYPKTGGAISELLGFAPTGEDWLPQPDEVLPFWMKDLGSFPVGGGEPGQETIYAHPEVPGNQALRTLDNPVEAITSSLNPLIKAPIELAMGKQFYGGIPIKDKSDYLLKSTPITGLAPRMANDQASLLSYLTGAGLSTNTEKRQKGELMRILDILNAQRKGLQP